MGPRRSNFLKRYVIVGDVGRFRRRRGSGCSGSLHVWFIRTSSTTDKLHVSSVNFQRVSRLAVAIGDRDELAPRDVEPRHAAWTFPVAQAMLGDAMNAGQVYVTLTRLEKAGLVAVERSADGADRSDRKVYALTPNGQQRVAEWIAEVSWPRPDLAEFHLKLIAAAAAGLADPLTIVDTQRRELLRRLRDAQRAAMAEPDRSDAALLLEGIVLRLQADLRWLEACEKNWTSRRSGS